MSKKCYCKGYASQREAAPRIWECPVHGKTGFATTMNIIDNGIAQAYDIPKSLAWDWAKTLLEWKKMEARINGETVYYCEDHFHEDLITHFNLQVVEDSPGFFVTWYKRLKENLQQIKGEL